MRFIKLETGERETADKRTRDAPVQGTSLLFWTFVRGSGRRTARLPVWRRGCSRRRFFVCGADRLGKRTEARGLREGRIRGIRCRTWWQDAASGVKKSRGQFLRSPLEILPPKKAREDGAFFVLERPGHFVLCLLLRRGTDGAAGRDASSLLRALWFRPRRPGFRTRRAVPADHASCLRADRPCGRDVPDTAPDPSSVPRAPAAGRHPGACPGAAAGRDGQ